MDQGKNRKKKRLSAAKSSSTDSRDSSSNEASDDDDRPSARKTPVRKIVPLNDCCRRVVSFRSYRLNDRSTDYSAGAARKVNTYYKLMAIQMPPEKLSGGESINILAS